MRVVQTVCQIVQSKVDVKRACKLNTSQFKIILKEIETIFMHYDKDYQ